MHSGDSACVLPAQSLTLANALEVEHVVRRLGPALGVVGLLNVQLAVADSQVYVLEANPRASRTVPFASKATGSTSSRRRAVSPPGEKLARSRPGAAAATESASRPRCSRSHGSRLRPCARAGDALDRRGDGERRRPADRVREGGARGRTAAADVRHGFLSVRDSDKPSAPGRGRARGPRLPARRDGRHRARCAPRARGGRGGEGRRRRRRRADRRRSDPGAALRPDRQHAAGIGGARRRLPDPRSGARRARAVYHDDLGRRSRRARDRERTRRDGPVPPGADRAPAPASASPPLRWASASCRGRGEPVGPYTLLRLARGGSTPACRGSSSCSRHRARAAAADVASASPRPASSAS